MALRYNDYSFTALAKIVNDENDATKQLVNPYSVKKASPYDLVELAKEVQKADSFVKATAGSKLQMIAEQIKFLQQQVSHCILMKNLH